MQQGTYLVMQNTLPDCFLEHRSSTESFITPHHLLWIAKKKKIPEFMKLKEGKETGEEKAKKW